MNHLRFACCAAALFAVAQPAAGQTTVRWSGVFYLDYEYILSSSDEETEGENGFDYRRLYLTADYTLSDEFSGRARLEAASQPTSSAPVVKDMYLKWKGVVGPGHDLVFGVQSPPVFTLSEKMWAYRSLEKTIMDRQKVVSSRDMGVSAAGKLTSDGNLSYGVMVGNNNSIRGEDDKYKRVYGQLAWQSGNVAASVGGDFASGDDRNAVNTHAFASYRADRVRLGAEGFMQQVDFDNSTATVDRSGISLWVVTKVNEKVEAVGRLDYSEVDAGASSISEVFVIGGFAFRPNPGVRVIPNVYLVDVEGEDDPEIAGRITLHADF